mgnify:CR=1 FL=1
MNKRVLSRSMFNRTARNKLYNKGGLPSVQKFQFGGMPTLPPIGTFEELFQRSSRAGDRIGLEALSANKFIPPALKARSIQEQQRLLQEQIANRASKNTSILDFLKNLVKPTDAQKEMSKDLNKKDDSLTSEKLKDLKIPEPKPSDVNLSDIPATEEAIKEKYGRGFKPEDIEKQSSEPLSETNLSQTEFDKQENPKGLETPKPDQPLADTSSLKNQLENIKTEVVTKADPKSVIAGGGIEGEPGAKDTLFMAEGLDVVNQAEETGLMAKQDIDKLLQNSNLESKDEKDVFNFNDGFLEAIGAKDPKKPFKSLKERVDTNMEVFRELFKRDPEDEKRIDALNLAYAGFAIAAGESPHALVNLGKGGMEFAKRAAKTQEKRKEIDDKIKFYAVEKALKSEESEIAFARDMEKWERGAKFTWLRDAKGAENQKNMLAARLTANRANFLDQIKSNETISNEKNKLRKELTELTIDNANNNKKLDRELTKLKLNIDIEKLAFADKKSILDASLARELAQLKTETSSLNALYSNFDESLSAAYFEFLQDNPNATLGDVFKDDSFFTTVKKYAEVLGSKKGQEYKLPYSKQGFIQTGIQSVMGDAAAYQSLINQLKKKEKFKTADPQDLLVEYFGDLWNKSQK